MGWVEIARMPSELKRNYDDTFPLLLMCFCGCSPTSQLFIHQGLGCFPYANVYSDLCPLVPRHHIIESERFLTATENVQPTIQEQIEADIEHLLDSYRRSKISPFFVMYVKKGCDSPMIAMLTSQSVWNNRSVKAYLLQASQSQKGNSMTLQSTFQSLQVCVQHVGAIVLSSTWRS